MSSPVPGAPAPLTRTHRLALGVMVVDALRGEPAQVEAALEDVPVPYAMPAPTGPGAQASAYDPGIGLPRLARGRRPGRFRLLFGARTAGSATVRVYDTARRYVPRRFEIPFASLADVLAEEASGARPAPRARRIAMFPGAAYHPQGCATGMRGRVVDSAGEPVRWVRVTARHPVRDVVLGSAHGDDRGEFLLVLGVPPTALVGPAGLTQDVALDLAARTAPPPGGPTGSAQDPLGDLLLETLPAVGAADEVSAGVTVPSAYPVRATVPATLRLGRLVSPDSPFTLPESE
ncbi:hypothetical protein ACFQ2B_02785 [Streptomyces stramineus]|uniref:Carboxypeptidase regulatory-like domain-containing protein n=1 Tax=Streptomyces stramineus TaxID=173861 RepID=A0ABP3JFC3_9ACTN